MTGHTYRAHWSRGLDFTRMKAQISRNWEETDLPIVINMNFTDQREAVEFRHAGAPLVNQNLTLQEGTADTWATGDNNVWNHTDVREFEFAITGDKVSAFEEDLEITGI